MAGDTAVTKQAPADGDRNEGTDGALHLLVLSPGGMLSFPLPRRGTVTVGRSASCGVRLFDPLASRRHALIRLGDAETSIEDLGSANGLHVRDQRVTPQCPIVVAVGEAVTIGSTVLILANAASSRGVRRWSHSYFQMKLAEACKRSELGGEWFALLRLHLDRAPSWAEVFAKLLETLPAEHEFAVYGPNEYELLLTNVGPAEVDRWIFDQSRTFGGVGAILKVATAWYPRDGRSPEALLARANDLLRPSRTPHLLTQEITSPAMEQARDLARRVAARNMNVLLMGETGVGKDVMANYIHQLSPRGPKSMVSINCAGLSETLIESELFGHEKGAFTGADRAKAGLLEAANGGTLFLDELGEMPLSVQAKLLRVIETRQVLPVGAREPRALDLRLLAATNRDLDLEIVKGTFRQDLFFRLNGMTILIPPLRERRSEILPLARLFVHRACSDANVPPMVIGSGAARWLENYSWPGNIRELRNVIERAALLCEGTEITPDHLPVERMRPADQKATAASDAERETAPVTAPSLAAADAHPEALLLMDALARCAGNQSRAAKLLGMTRRIFISKLDRYAIPRPQKDPPRV